ncbi:MAG: SGNH/GDSL hydrolase family protein [Limisphaerales bacterium]
MNPLRIFAGVLLLSSGLLAQSDYPLRQAVECTPRSGLPNLFAKVAAGESVKVAYLGGSITAASGWRVKSREWLQKIHPKAKFEEIHAAIGGTGSDLGVFRLERDVLRHKPDLLFVEFAVNDGGASPERIHKAMEGIVRQTWQANPKTDICYVYTLTERFLGDLQSGKMPRAASAMEELADHYGIPSIHFGVEVARLEQAGEIVFKAPKPKDWNAKPKVFSSDGVHPHVQTGHELYVEAIARSWPSILRASKKPKTHELGKPLRADNWEKAKMVSIKPEMLRGEWRKLPADHRLSKRFRRNMPELYQAAKPGATLTFKFEGTTAGMFDILGPDGGQLRYQVNESKGATRNRIDGYCTYHRMSKLNVANEITPGIHRVEITLLPTKLDKQKILFERNRGDLKSKPEKYRDHTWYASAIMLIGDIAQ